MNSRLRWLWLVFLLGVLVGSGSIRARAQQSPHFQNGLQYYVQNDFGKARRHFRTAVNQDSTAVKPRFFLGNTARRLGDTAAAIQHYRRVLELDPVHTSARSKLATLHFNEKNWPKAVKHYRRLAEAHPDKFLYRFRLGVAQYKNGNLGRAKENVLQARKINPKSGPAHFYLGRILMRRGEYLNAASRFNRAIELNPSNGKYRFYRALAYFREQDYRSKQDAGWHSAEGFQRAIDAGYDSPKTHFMYGNSLLNRGLYYLKNDRFEEGIQLLKSSVKQFRRVLITDWNASNAYHNMGVAYLAIGKLDLAKRAVENAIMAEPSVPFFHDTLGEIYFQLGEFGKAIESFNLVRELDGGYDSHPFEPLYFERSIDDRLEEAKLRR